ncbi:MAG: lipid-transfer protein [Candidatus Acidiferrales bacterium]
MARKVFVIGVGMTKFEKPFSRDWNYPDMVREAVTSALSDAGVSYDRIEQAAVGYCYGDSTSGQRALYSLGLSGIPIYNVNNNCSTGSTALLMTKQFVEGGISDCVLAVGFEKMQKGSLNVNSPNAANPLQRHLDMMVNLRGKSDAPPAAQIFGNAGREHMERYGSKPEHFAKVAWKNHHHSINNPNAQFQQDYTLADILNSPMIYEPLTRLQCCPTSDGAAAAIVASEEFVKQHNLSAQAVEIAAMAMATDMPSTFDDHSCIKLAGYDLSREAARRVYEHSGLGPENVDVIELHDCFSTNELVTYEALGLCPEGKGGELIDSGAVTYGGRSVVNPSGGLISKGHPLGATGIAQCTEITWQLRNEAGKRQVPGAKVGLQHNLGLGGAAVVTMYRAPEKAEQ